MHNRIPRGNIFIILHIFRLEWTEDEEVLLQITLFRFMLHLSDRLQIENCVKCSHTVVPTDCTHLQIMKHTHTLTYNICMYAGMYMHIYQMAYKDCHSFVDNLSMKKEEKI